MIARPLRIDPHPYPEHQLVALALGLHGFRGELRLASQEGDFCRNRRARIGVEHDPRIGADLDPAGFRGRQIDVHVDIRDIQHGEDLAARRQHLADIGDAVLQPTVARCHQVVVLDVDHREPDVMLGCFQRALGLSNPLGGGSQSGISAVERLLALIEQFLGGKAVFQQALGSVQFLRRQSLLGALLLQIGVGLVDSTLRLLDLGLALAELLLQISCVHTSNDLPGADHVTDLGVQLGDPAWKFCVDIDLVGLQPAVAKAYADGKLRLRVLPPIDAGTSRSQKHGDKPDREPQSSPVPGQSQVVSSPASCFDLQADERSHF